MKLTIIDPRTGHTVVEDEVEAIIVRAQEEMNRGRYTLLVEDPPGAEAVPRGDPTALRAHPQADAILVPQLAGGCHV